MDNQNLICVIADSITNSVFESQVLMPLARSHSRFTIISFERHLPDQQYHQKLQKNYPNVTFVLIKRLPYLTALSMFFPIKKLKKILNVQRQYTLLARGPVAGYIALKALDSRCASLIIQARGLLAAEYEYEHRGASWYTKIIHFLRRLDFSLLEKITYSGVLFNSSVPTTIESVSSALRDYLIATYGTPCELICVAEQDKVRVIEKEQLLQWRAARRSSLSIPSDATVYCYSGSAKSWQCPDQTLLFFKKKFQSDPRAILLICTQDRETFLKLIKKYDLPSACVIVKSVNPSELLSYLAAADKGIILRETHLLNWVSRPTKALEYHAAGLEIVHNNTVDWLIQEYSYYQGEIS